MSDATTDSYEHPALEAAFRSLATSARNVPGVDFVSVAVHEADDSLRTAASTDLLAERADALQYELLEGPCYSIVTGERFVLVNDLTAAVEFPRYASRAVDLGVEAHAAILIVVGRRRVGLNLYARAAGSFDRSTVQFAEFFAGQATAVLGYAEQVEQLGVALHARGVIGAAIGILMERHGIDRDQAFAFLVRNSQDQNIKVRVLAEGVLNGTFHGARARGPADRANVRLGCPQASVAVSMTIR